MHLIMWPGAQDKMCPSSVCGTHRDLSETHNIPPCQRPLTSLTNLNSMMQHLKWAFLNVLASWPLASHHLGIMPIIHLGQTHIIFSVLYLQPLLLYWFHPLIYKQKTLSSHRVPPAFTLCFASLQPFAGFWKGSLSAASTSQPPLYFFPASFNLTSDPITLLKLLSRLPVAFSLVNCNDISQGILFSIQHHWALPLSSRFPCDSICLSASEHHFSRSSDLLCSLAYTTNQNWTVCSLLPCE